MFLHISINLVPFPSSSSSAKEIDRERARLWWRKSSNIQKQTPFNEFCVEQILQSNTRSDGSWSRRVESISTTRGAIQVEVNPMKRANTQQKEKHLKWLKPVPDADADDGDAPQLIEMELRMAWRPAKHLLVQASHWCFWFRRW